MLKEPCLQLTVWASPYCCWCHTDVRFVYPGMVNVTRLPGLALRIDEYPVALCHDGGQNSPPPPPEYSELLHNYITKPIRVKWIRSKQGLRESIMLSPPQSGLFEKIQNII